MKRKQLSSGAYLGYLNLLEDSFRWCLQENNIMARSAREIAAAAEQRAAEDSDYDKWKDPIVKLCLDWVLIEDYIRQFEEAPETWSYEQNKRCWRMATWNKHIEKLWKEWEEDGRVFLSDII